MTLHTVRNGVRRWAGERLSDLAASHVARLCRRSAGEREPPTGISVVSFQARRNGITQGARLQVSALASLGVPVREVDASASVRNPWARADAVLGGDAVVAHADGRQVGLALNALAPAVAKARRVGYCAWELASPPPWKGFDAPLDEVWTPSRFSADALAALCTTPVRVMPHVCRPPDGLQAGLMRRRLGLSVDLFVGLVLADARSSLARKNPAAAVAAFCAAFAGRRDVALVLKISAGAREPGLVEALKRSAGAVRTVFVEEHLDDTAKWSLFLDVDVLVSLHRAEGFGLPLLEAMTLGKPVVATGWSGNMDFMGEHDALPIPFRLVEVKDSQGVYARGEWAEPDGDAAVEALRRLRAAPEFAARIGAAARARAAPERQLAALFGQAPVWVLQTASRGEGAARPLAEVEMAAAMRSLRSGSHAAR